MPWTMFVVGIGLLQLGLYEVGLSLGCSQCRNVVNGKISLHVFSHANKTTIKPGFYFGYGVYADHFAHLGCVFSATNADLRVSA